MFCHAVRQTAQAFQSPGLPPRGPGLLGPGKAAYRLETSGTIRLMATLGKVRLRLEELGSQNRSDQLQEEQSAGVLWTRDGWRGGR